MSNETTTVSTGGTSAGTLLGVLFVGLKLGGVIDWSWWWVTCPFWAMPVGVILGLGVWLLAIGAGKAFQGRGPLGKEGRRK